MSVQVLEMFTRITEVKEQQGFSWETASHIVVVVPAIILLFLTIYRYYTATPLDKFFLEGVDKVWMQAGKIIEVVILIGSVLFIGNLIPFCAYNIIPGFGKSMYESVLGFAIIIFPTAFIASRINYDIGVWKNRRIEKSRLVSSLMSMLLVTVSLIVVYIFWGRYKIKTAIKIMAIKFAIDMILIKMQINKTENPYKNNTANNNFRLLATSCIVGILLCLIDIFVIAYMGDLNDFVPQIICLVGACVVLVIFIIFVILISKPCEVRENIEDNGKLSRNRIYGEFVEFLIFASIVVVFGPLLMREMGFHSLEIIENGVITPQYNISRFIQQIFEKIPTMLFVISLEEIVLLWIGFEIDWKKAGLKSEDKEMKLLDLNTGRNYYAYGVINGDIVYGEEKDYDKVKIPRFIPLSYIEGSEGTSQNYLLVHANMSPIECETKQVITKFKKRKGVLIDVSNKRTFEREHPSMARSIPKLTNKGKMWCSIEKTRDRVSALFRSVDIDDIDKDQEILIYHKDNRKAEIAAWRCIIAGYKNVVFTKGAADWKWEHEDGFYSWELVDQTIDEDE
jgi:membrane protein